MREMGQSGRELVEREFTWDRLAEKMLDTYLRVLRRPVAWRLLGFRHNQSAER
jgi:hypothetical protein